jgi:hypothetical protein
MTETASNERKISISFSRKISDGNYGTIEASAWVQGDAPTDMNAADVALLVGDLFTAASVAVFDQLGIEYEFDAENSVIREKPKTTVQSAQAAVERIFPGSTVETVSAASTIRVMNPAESDGPLPEWLVRAAVKDGITAVWDNRRKAEGTKAPHFKEAVPRGGSGHGKDGEPKPFWPPK